MFPQLKKINNESGIVLFLVLMSAIIIMIMSVGILTESLSEENYAQQQIDQITSDELAKGIFWNGYSSGMQNVGISNANLNGRTYEYSLNSTSTSGTYNITVNYDTFQ